MTNKNSNDRANHELVGAEANLAATFSTHLSNLYGFLRRYGDDVRFLKVTQRGSLDWLAILGALDADGLPTVCFGAGESYYGALAGLNRAVAKGDWKEDRFETGKAKPAK